MTTTELAQQLENLGYLELFMRMNNEALDSIWKTKSNRTLLVTLCSESNHSALSRFLASEILYFKDNALLKTAIKRQLLPVYVEILAHKENVSANVWGLPNTVGEVGHHLLDLDDKYQVIHALLPLLEDTSKILYDGSREATMGNSYNYRIKDIAAFYISQKAALPYSVKKTPKDRDEEISSLKATVSKMMH